MGHSPHLLSRDARVRAAWPAPLTAAEQPPGLWRDLVRLQPQLLPHVAAAYAHLQALPRRVRRALQRHWRLPLATLALWLALGQLPALAATIPVGGACTLVDALTASNTDAAMGGCLAGSGVDTIVLPAGSTQTLTEVNNNTYGATGLPVITSVITISGQGSTIRRAEGAPEFRLLAVHSTGDLTLQETTLRGGLIGGYNLSGGGVANFGGTLLVTNSSITGNTARSCVGSVCRSRGGGVGNFGGTLLVTNSTISGNTAYGYSADGGGIGNYVGTATVTNSTISGNSGGGVRSFAGTLTVTNSTISGNTGGGVGSFADTLTVTNSTISGNSGGGIENSVGTLSVTNSTISGNSAYYGGGIGNYAGSVTVTNSTISGNTAYGSLGRGGGIGNHAGSVTVTNSTISGNTAAGSYGLGGGIENSVGTLTVTNSTITGNTAAESGGGIVNRGYRRYDGNIYNSILILARTLISGNTAPTGPEIFNDPTYDTVTADAHNLLGVDGAAGVEGFSPGPTDVVPPAGVRLPDIIEPALALHGGRTQTLAVVPGSPAIDAGGPVCLDAEGAPLLTDQRGRPRPVDGNGDGQVACDIGAFEFFPIVNDLVTLDPDLDTGFDPTPVPGGPAGSFTVTATFTNASATALRTPFFEVTALSGGNLLLNADDGPGGVGATLTPAVGDGVLAPGETVAADFVIGLQVQAPFTFVVELFGEPVP